MPLLKDLFNAFPGTPVDEGTFKAFVKGMEGFKIETAAWAIERYVQEETRFPTVAAIRKIAERKSSENLATVIEDQKHLIEDTSMGIQFMRRVTREDTPEDKAARYRQLRKYPTVLARHKERDNW